MATAMQRLSTTRKAIFWMLTRLFWAQYRGWGLLRQRRRMPDKSNLDDLLDVLLRTPPIEYTCSQSTDIHSPGFNRYVSGSIVSLVIAALTAALIELGEGGSKKSLASEISNFVVMNSAPGADPQCTARVSQASAMVLSALGTDKTWALCEAARDAARRAGLRSSATPKR